MTLHSGELRELLASVMPEVLVTPIKGPEPVQENASSPAKRTVHGAILLVLQEDDVVVTPESVPQVASYLREQLGYAFLSHITATDYLQEALIEVIYVFYHLEGGGPQTVRVRCPRDEPVIPSLTPIWPGANLQEREAYDLYGVQFPGHPFLRRIYMWDEFEGYPMRKDFPKTGDKYTHITGGD